MFPTRNTYGFRTLGPFYVTTQIFGLLSAREVGNKVCCSDTGPTGGNDGTPGRSGDTGRGDVVAGVFSPDRRYLAYNALVMVLFYWTSRRCASLVGSWPCADAVSCSSAIEWIVAAAGAAHAMVFVAVATVHRHASTAGLLNRVHDVVARGASASSTGRRSHVSVTGTYAATVAAITVARSAAAVAARPDRFRVADVLMLWLPVAAVPIVVECVIVCVCAAAENTCHDVVDRLDRLAADGRSDHHHHHHHHTRHRLPMHWRLEMVWRDHWRVCRLVDHLSRCFGLDLAVDLTANMLLFIGYAYVTLMSVHATWSAGPDGDAAAVYWNVALACQLACVSFRIVFVSYRAEKIKQVATNSVLISLRNLLKQNNNLDISTIMLISAFTYQIMNREVKISACGFFPVNLSFFHALIRLATTYLIVIIQYNSDPLQSSHKSD